MRSICDEASMYIYIYIYLWRTDLKNFNDSGKSNLLTTKTNFISNYAKTKY